MITLLLCAVILTIVYVLGRNIRTHKGSRDSYKWEEQDNEM